MATNLVNRVRDKIHTQLIDAAARLRKKGLFVPGNDSLSMRIPGTEEFLLATATNDEIETATFASDSPHAMVYRSRSDAGAVLVGTTQWSVAIAAIGKSPPTMFDEQARHIGKIPAVIAETDTAELKRAIETDANIIFYGHSIPP